MSPTPDSALDDPQQIIAHLRRELAQRTAERDEVRLRLAESTTERDEALEQQTATAEVLQVINSSPGDLAPVFDAILEKAHTLCGAPLGSLVLWDGEQLRAVATRGYPQEYDAIARQGFSPTPPFRRLLSGELFVHAHNLATPPAPDEEEHSTWRAAVETAGIRSALFVPLRKDAKVLGYISAQRQEVRPFSDKQIALLQNFAAQAVIAIENARLFTETREALEQQTATADVLQVINSSPGDLAPVFDAVLEKAHALCGVSFGSLLLYDGGQFHAGATRGLPEPLTDLLRQPFPPDPDGPLARLLAGERFYQIGDQAELLKTSLNPRARATFDLAGVRTVLWVPLRRDEALLGAIVAYRQEVRPFSDKQIALLQNFAAQAVIAMENARLITETREALEQQTATAEVLGVINSSPGDRTPVFEAILEKARILCGAAHGSLSLYDGERFRAVAINTRSQELPDRMRQGFLLSDFPHLKPLLDGARFVHVADLAETGNPYGARTGLFMPLRKDDALLGLISTIRLEIRRFSDKEIALVENFAAQAVIAMENARLITETREALDQQTATAEILEVINRSPGDLAPVFEVILEKAHSLCGAMYGSLHIADGEAFRGVAVRGLPEAFADFIRQPIQPGPNHPVRELIGGAPFAAIINSPEFDDPVIQSAFKLGHMRTGLFVPLRKDDVLLGYIVASRQEVRPFSDKQIALLQNFAAQAVIAMENARLITETREALEQQTATAEVLGVINSSPGDLAPVFDAMLEKTLRLCEAAHGNFLTYDGEVFHRAAFRGEPQFAEYRRQQGPQRPAENSQLARMVQGGGTLHRIDAREGEAYRDDPAFRRMVDGLGIRTSLTVPLRKGDALLGAVRAYRREVRPFTDKQIALVENFAAQAVIAMENARLLGELRQRTEEVGELNRDLEARVAEQVDELGRVGRLKRFLAPQLAELIVSQGDEKILESHRREIVVVFCDLRGYTAFTETAEPEEVLDFLRQYHGALGPLVSQFEGTLDQFSGDGIMVFFNDPVPCADPAERAVKMAMAMRSAANTLIADWRERGRDLGFGAGIAQGYATLGQIGFSERSGYTAIGTVCNVAARLCAEAKDGQILLSQLVNVALRGSVTTEQLGPLTLKGLTQPVVAYNVPLAATQPAFRVIEGGSPQTV